MASIDLVDKTYSPALAMPFETLPRKSAQCVSLARLNFHEAAIGRTCGIGRFGLGATIGMFLMRDRSGSAND